MTQKIKTAVFPVAGLGTRFLPVTKAGPKEMLPIIDKPLIQYVVEEAISAGITQLILVTSSHKRAIEDYFDVNYELEDYLEKKGKTEALGKVNNILPPEVSVVYVRQPKPLGLGDAVLRAKDVVGNSPFAVLLADDIIDCGKTSCLKSMVDLYEKTSTNILAVEQVAPAEVQQYGVVALADRPAIANQISRIVEKPSPEKAPSCLAVMGRYILSPRIFDCLKNTTKGVGGEIQLTDAIELLLQIEPVLAYPFAGKRYDCGSRLGFLKATIAYALKHPELKEHLNLSDDSILKYAGKSTCKQ